MWKIIVVSLLSVRTLSQDTIFTNRIFEFEKHWQKFLKQYLGCDMSQDKINEEVCKTSLGSINYKEFQLSREAAKKLFDLAEPK